MTKNVAWLDDVHELMVESENLEESLTQGEPIILTPKKEIRAEFLGYINEKIGKFSFSEPLTLGEKQVLSVGGKRFQIYPRKIVRTHWFENNYCTESAQLGAIYGKDATTFRIWAPTAINVLLYLDNNKINLKKCSKGIWEVVILGDCHEATYEYGVEINGKVEKVIDPYAKALLANSKKGVVVDFSRTNSSYILNQQRPFLKNVQDAIIYELHVRDATVDAQSGVKNKGRFLGLTEKDTVSQNGLSSGLSYIKQLGITHVQLLPINDFARVDETNPHEYYNWGYDPLYFQVPEGSYASDPHHPITRIYECKKMIASLHNEGLSVILDVVYNHVFKREESSFEKIVPGYYFRYKEDGSVSNGTGVGNDLATERRMVRKFILDTIDFWLSEYKVDGFRFDLMGAIDIVTMKEIEKRCAEEETKIILLGEGWDLPTALPNSLKTIPHQSHQVRGISFFNDLFRDSLKGTLFDMDDRGYVNGEGKFIERLPHLVSGSVDERYGIPFVSEVHQSVNYVECHDNHTLWDRLMKTNRDESEEHKKRMHQLATGITLLSQGIPFLHAGQEWFRTKKGDGNSYISGDEINQLDWLQRGREEENISFIRSLVQIRKKYDSFRLSSKEEIRKHLHILSTPNPVFGFMLLTTKEDLAIYVNPTREKYELHLPSAGTWEVLATNLQQKDLSGEIKGEFSSVRSYELIVLKKSRY
ncbi:type I pullulanase [Bacillus shivajii]|uniref:type I pullulanase n=1 Tax=Bacillus shivajii TaxID=1983719 RepID=UPI001CF98A86|nr:type I pullulanase [Bacillus shivajii]UCZ52431.1 type I pullulanase [Bacillus shivajii]